MYASMRVCIYAIMHACLSVEQAYEGNVKNVNLSTAIKEKIDRQKTNIMEPKYKRTFKIVIGVNLSAV